MNEEFAIKLKTILDQSSIAAVKQQLAALKQEVSENLSEATSAAASAAANFDSDAVTQYTARIELLKYKIDELSETVKAMHEHPDLWDPKIILEAEADLEKLRAQLDSLMHKGQSSVSVINKTSVSISNNFKSAFKQASRFVMALVGVRGIYAALRKSMNSFLAQNDELQNKLNGAWYALGSLFAPVLEWIIDKFVYLVSLVDAFVKSLGFAGVNMSKYGKAAGKAAKERKQLAGFDELNNMSSQDSSGGGGGAGMELKPISEEALATFKSILAVVAAIGAGIAAWKVAEGINHLFGNVLSPSQLAGIGLAVGGVTLAILSFLNYLKDPTWINFGLIITGIGTAIAGVGLIIGSTPMIVAGVVTLILGILAAFWPQISAGIDWIIGYIDDHLGSLKEWLTTWFGGVGTLIGTAIDMAWNIVKGAIEGIQKLLDGLFRGAKQILDGIIQIFKGDFKGGITNVLQGLLQIAKGVLNGGIAVINGFLRAISSGINFMIDMINSVKFDVPSWVPLIGGKHIGFNISHVNSWQIPSLDVGTNYVPNDMLAQIHQGEAVVPKEFNEDQFSRSEETNDLLRQLIEVVDSKEFRTYISQRDIGEASIRYQRQQQRILGGSLT